MNQLNESYNAKTGKAGGFFHHESGAFPLSGWLSKYMAGTKDFVSFSGDAVEHLTRLMEESNLSMGGSALFCHYLQGMTDYLVIPLLQEAEGTIDHRVSKGAPDIFQRANGSRHLGRPKNSNLATTQGHHIPRQFGSEGEELGNDQRYS
ncbi:nucleoid-associated protein [Pseudomonas sp. PCH199]|nr:nucleoid-associated protein [Pseudomonas sp. PCH199]